MATFPDGIGDVEIVLRFFVVEIFEVLVNFVAFFYSLSLNISHSSTVFADSSLELNRLYSFVYAKSRYIQAIWAFRGAKI